MPQPNRMDTPAGAYKKPLDAQTLATANGGGNKPRVKVHSDGSFTVAGLNPETFFSPGMPLNPQVQDPRFGAYGRRFDYQTLGNTNYTPRGNSQITFADLRALARNHDVTRLCIETRKDQMEALDWKLAYKDKKKEPDAKIDKLTEIFRFPDKRRPYNIWMRALLEEVFVTDALCIYPQFTNGGDFYGFRWMDGARIKPVIDASGDYPIEPGPDGKPSVAFQHVLKGMPAVDYTFDDIVYWPRNQTVDSLYGYPNVEQIIVIINIALRREIFQLDYYRMGSVPDAMVGVPENWTPEQLMAVQTYWDSMFDSPGMDNLGERRRLKFMPSGNIKFAKDQALKDEFDEWLARVACYCFSVEPTPFVKQVNRGTGETQKEQSREEGILPLKKFWKSLKDFLLMKYLDAGDVEFLYDEEEAVDPLSASQIDVAEVNAGIVTRDEVRQGRGLEALPQPEEVNPTVSSLEVVAGSATPAPANPGAKAEVAQPTSAKEKINKAAPPERRTVMIQRQRLTRAVKRQLRAQAGLVKDSVGPLIGTAKSAAELESAIDYKAMYSSFPGAVKDPLKRVAGDGAKHGVSVLNKLQKDDASGSVAIEPGFIDIFALDYADERGAEMVGMKWVDGVLVENPDAKWTITDETRKGIQDLLGEAIDDGWTLDQFSEELADAYAFSPQRADMIARTETRLADSRGQVEGWKASGVVAQKVWLISNDGCCDDCQDNSDEGPIDIDDDFPSGDDSPPAHPNCKCVVAPIVAGEEE